MSIPPNDAILGFWSWFATAADALGEDLDNEKILEELDHRVAELGEFGWEVGPGTVAENALVISPDGELEKLAVTQHIVSLAPKIANWEILFARPSREPSLEFSMAADAESEFAVDARPWRYVLLRLNESNFRIIIEQNNLHAATDEDRYTAAALVLDGILGERRRLETIQSVEIATVLDRELDGRAQPIEQLSKHLSGMTP
jgi:hypothetical protein